jgi:phage-related protein
MDELIKVIPAIFFRSVSGAEPVREWLKELSKEDRIIIGADIKTVEFGWPVGMPTCRSLKGYKDLWEVRSKLSHRRIARVLFFIYDSKMILLHGFIKKTQKTSNNDLNLAMQRKKEHEENDKKST